MLVQIKPSILLVLKSLPTSCVFSEIPCSRSTICYRASPRDSTSQTYNQEDSRRQSERQITRNHSHDYRNTQIKTNKPTTPHHTSELSSSSSSPCQHIAHKDVMTPKNQVGYRNLWLALKLGQTVNATLRAKWV